MNDYIKRILILITFGLNAQDNNIDLKFNHQALLVNNLQETGDFYLNVLDFDEIFVGAGQSPPKRWFKNYEGKEIHLILQKASIQKQPKGIHMAYSVKNINSFIKHLNKHKVKYSNWAGETGTIQLRADGVNQIWIRDPAGYWIEINEAKYDNSRP